jgi:serine/threonine protein kinase
MGQHFGNYQLVKLLGQGGYAEVYLGKHRHLNSYAALKVLNTAIHPEDEHTFQAEAQTLVDLRHPNIVRLLDFAIESGPPVLIMDYAPNGSFFPWRVLWKQCTGKMETGCPFRLCGAGAACPVSGSCHWADHQSDSGTTL